MKSRPVLAIVAALSVSACADTRPPLWEDGAQLTVALATSSALTLTWRPATDDREMAGYRLYLDGVLIEEIDEPARASTEIGDLAELTTVEVRLEPVDAAGNVGAALTVTARTSDGQAPIWPPGAALRIDASPIATGWRLRASWPAATDNHTVTEYRLQLGDDLSAQRIRAPETSIELDIADPPGSYTLIALDDAVNVSEPLVATWSPPAPAEGSGAAP